jgi:cytochrome b561
MAKLESQTRGYDPVAKGLHWIIFLLLAAQYAVGSIMPHIGRKTLDQGLVAWHLSIGAAILLFIVLKLIWRFVSPVPLLATMPVWQRRLASATHWLLYLLVFAMTFLGWAAANYRGWDVKLFGVVTLPPLAEKGARWAHQAGDIHDWMLYVLAGVIGLHVLGALYHYFFEHDAVLERMLPMAGSSQSSS